VLVSAATVAELRFGAIKAGWSELRCRALERDLAQLTVVQPDDELITVCAQLRADGEQAGLALGQKIHEATAGSPRRRFVSMSHSYPPTQCSATCRASSSSSPPPTPTPVPPPRSSDRRMMTEYGRNRPGAAGLRVRQVGSQCGSQRTWIRTDDDGHVGTPHAC
jgi:hypothetical protein